MVSSTDYFKRLKEAVDQAPLVPSFKKELQAALVYFIVQSEMSIEERTHPKFLRKEWVEFCGKTRSLKLFDKYKNDEFMWRTIRCFVHHEEPTTLLVVKDPPPPPPKKKFEGFTADDFFDHLAHQEDYRQHMTHFESEFLQVAMWYLSAQAKLPAMQRNTARNTRIWNKAQPILKKLKIYEATDIDSQLESKLNIFLTGSIIGQGISY
jgi:hypothetical protein